MIRVHVKGPKKSARRDAPCSAYSKVVRWFGDERPTAKKGRGHPPGTLLHYSESCARSELRGGRRRKKRRR